MEAIHSSHVREAVPACPSLQPTQSYAGTELLKRVTRGHCRFINAAQASETAVPKPSGWFLRCSGNGLLSWQSEDPRVSPSHLLRLAEGCWQPQQYPTVSIMAQQKLRNRTTIRSSTHCPPTHCFDIQHRNFFSVKFYHVHCGFINIFLWCRQTAGCFSCTPGRQAGFS